MSAFDEDSHYMEVDYKFLLPHADYRLKIFQKAEDLHSALDEIYCYANTMEKNDITDPEQMSHILTAIKDMAQEFLEQ